MSIDEVAERAMAAIRSGDPRLAREALEEAVAALPQRIDLHHALAVTLLQLGESAAARDALDEGIALAHKQADDAAATLMPLLRLSRAAAREDTYDPEGAEADYLAVLASEPDHPRALQGLGHLLLAWGRPDEGLARLAQYVAVGGDGPEYVEATSTFIASVRKFIADDLHPRNFLEAHRGAYVEFFDHHASRMEAEGWIAEAARMQRLPDGTIAPIIPDGARPYAAVRVDLVDPSTGQPGQIGDQPMVVALAGYEPLAQAMVLSDWPDQPYPVWVSSVCPWDQLPVQVRFGYDSNPIEALDPTMGDWYRDGYNGAFGQTDRGRLHYISDPERTGARTVLYHVDCGRAELRCIEDLLQRIELLDRPYKVESVLIGRGFLPVVRQPLPPEVTGGRS